MSLAPVTAAIPRGVSTSNQQKVAPWANSLAATGVPVFLLLVFLLAYPTPACALEPTSPFDDLASHATAARDQGNLALAIELYSRAEQLKPDWAEGWFYLGLLQYSSNAFPSAIDAFNHFLLIQPGAAPALALRGLSEFETGAYEDALRDLEQGVAEGAANEPRNEQIIRYHFAQLLTRAGRFEDAITQYQFFAAKHINNPDLQLGLGLAGMRVQALPKDTPAEDRAFLQSVGSAGYTFLSGDSDGAQKQFNQLIAGNPSSPELFFFYGVLLFSHSPDLAIDQFRNEVALAPGSPYAHAMLAYSLMIAGRYVEARQDAQRALAVAPDMEMAQIALGRSLAEQGDTQRAAELLNQVLQRDPDNLEAHMGLAAIYSRSGRREDAYRERKVCLGLAQ
ncbi:MAG: tetratricopeptide repeat protein [Terracidiphilus sp.]|jgi:tetratricopeptide (TPR) repeat protein